MKINVQKVLKKVATLPDGEYLGKWGGYVVEVTANGEQFEITLDVGMRGINTFTAEYGMRGNVWTGKTRGQEIVCEKLLHPAMMPNWLARDSILSQSNPD